MLIRSVAAAAMLGVSITGQCFYVPDNLPSQGLCNLIPFGAGPGNAMWANQKMQTVVTKAQLGNTKALICGLAFAPCASGRLGIGRLTITMDHFAGGTLSPTFANNVTANAMTMLDIQSFDWPVVQDVWAEIGLAAAFPYDPALGDLLVEITVAGTGFVGSQPYGMRRYNTGQRVFASGYASTPPAAGLIDSTPLKMRVCFGVANATTYGQGCPAATPLTMAFSGSSQFGKTLYVDLTGGPTTGNGIVWLGGTVAPPLPMDLTSINMPGCWLRTTIDFPIATTFTAGVAQVSIAITNNPNLTCGAVFVQAAALDPAANPLGVSVSGYGRVVVGI